MLCNIPLPPGAGNLLVPSYFPPKTGKFGLIRQKHRQNKVCRARRGRHVARKTRVEQNKHTSRVQNFNGYIHTGLLTAKLPTRFHEIPLAGLAPIPDGATQKPENTCHRRIATF
jgi:hypothetical protein